MPTTLTLAPPWSDNAVVQRGLPLSVCGWADPGKKVEACFAGDCAGTVATDAGAWSIVFGSHEAGGPHDLTVAAGDERIAIHNILVGEVWICSGQSNMEMPLASAENGRQEAAGAADDSLRLFRVSTTVMDQPQVAVKAVWTPCVPAAAASFSAVGYYFGAHLRRELNMPVGLMQAAVGNTPCESWTPRDILERRAEYAPVFERWRRALSVFPDTEGAYQKAFAEWDRLTDQAEREGRPIPGAHPKLIGPGHPWTPAGLFNGMIAPLTRVPIRGVIWYQGAGAPERAYQYRQLFRDLIHAWRREWKQDDFPFLFVQEAGFGPRRQDPGEHSWAELREAQAMALELPNTGMAVAIDCGDATDIHPARKKPIGERLGLIARARIYGQTVPCAGPTFRSLRVEGDHAIVKFDHADGGLMTSDGKPVRGFAVSGGAVTFEAGNRGFAWAHADIRGDEILVSAPGVSRPVAVRYAWAQNPDCNLVNGAGLPAAPFRTDDWPGVTVANQ